jgi:hypothetical protein
MQDDFADRTMATSYHGAPVLAEPASRDIVIHRKQPKGRLT